MSDYGDRMRNYSTAAAQAIKPLSREAANTLTLSDDDQIAELNVLLAKAFMEGVMAGEAEVLAVATEQGVNVAIEKLRPPE